MSATLLKRPKLLLVDDIRANLLLLVKVLGEDYECRLATDGPSALQQAVEDLPDLILLDVLMPGMNGYEVCRRLKADARTAHIPVIFLTNLGEEEDEKTGLDAGAIDYITKPFRIPIVKARVRNHLELKHRGDLLERQAGLDGLTGLFNRRRFDETLTMVWQHAQQHGAPLALIMIDVDFFKMYNDRYGHPQGDDCLRKVAGALAVPLQSCADFLLARYGGEEFAAILAHTTLEEAVQYAEQMHKEVIQLAIPHEYSEVAAWVTVSIGVAGRTPGAEDTAARLLADADAALYCAKQRGRNRVEMAVLQSESCF